MYQTLDQITLKWGVTMSEYTRQVGYVVKKE